MSQPKVCPECGSRETVRNHFATEVDRVIEVRTCSDCPTQYEVRYGDPIKEATLVPGPDGQMIKPDVRDALEARDDD